MTSSHYLLLFFLLNFGLTFAWSSIRVYRQTGINPITFTAGDSAHDFAGRLFKVLLVLLLGIVLTNAFVEEGQPYLLPFSYLPQPTLAIAGWWLLHLSLLLIVVAQYGMGLSWRIGIDSTHRTELVTNGVFRFSRNPIFLGMWLSLLGLFFVLPNAFTLLVLGTGYVLIGVQVRLEESHLTNLHGEAYQRYQKRVRRWM